MLEGNARPLAIPSWVPPAAADVIAWHAALPGVTVKNLALLERLATAAAMRDVWRKTNAIDADEIVSIILRAEAAASDLRPPLPRTTENMAVHLKELGETPLFPTTPGHVAFALGAAAKDMRDHEVNARLLWANLWTGEPDVTFDKLLSILRDAAVFYGQLEAAYQIAAAEADPLPAQPRKRGSKTAKETYFVLILSDFFERVGGSPQDDVVATIASVVFDDASAGPDAWTVRGKRRRPRRRKADQT